MHLTTRPFDDFAERFERLRAAELIGVNWDKKEREKEPPGRDPHFWLRSPQDPHSPLVEDLAIVRRELGLEPGRDDFRLTAFPFRRQPNEVGIRCRSLLGILYFLSQAVQLPADHVRAGLGTITQDESGQPFDWSKLMNKVMRIRSQKERPENAYVAVQHRGWWFYIADDDQNSKATFSLLNILFSLQSASEKGKSPLLTLPLG